jgi:hypothetical protein
MGESDLIYLKATTHSVPYCVPDGTRLLHLNLKQIMFPFEKCEAAVAAAVVDGYMVAVAR